MTGLPPARVRLHWLDRLPPDHVLRWRELASRPSLEASPYATHGFALARAAAGGRVRVLAVCDGGDDDLFLPFEYPSRSARIAGLAVRVGGDMNDAMAAVCARPRRLDPAALAAAAGVGCFVLDHAPQDGWEVDRLDARPHVGWVARMGPSFGAYWAARKDAHRQHVLNAENRVRKIERELGPLRYTQRACDSDEALATLIARKREQYRQRGVADSLGDPQATALLRALHRQADPQSALVLGDLSAGDTWLASHLSLRNGPVVNYWFPVYDAAHRSFSPGIVMLLKMLETLHADGDRVLDFGEGDSDYKRLFGTDSYVNLRGLAPAPGARGGLAMLKIRIDWRIRALSRPATGPTPDP
jgi:CelD/BcsL family acetyltransferase involved in cellulose biosynthesis